jgi:hypothetical protein
MLHIFIGYDQAETIAYHVLAHSLLRQATGPISVTPIVKSQITNVYRRGRGPLESTDFSLTRFMVPYLSQYEGYSLFLDCDMLCKADPYQLLMYGLAHPSKAVHVVQHDYTPKSGKKFLGNTQTVYPRKNWSSVMLFDNQRCKALLPEYISTASPLSLHRFEWVKDEEIGTLPLEWNWLVGEYEPNPDAKLLHYTLGTPCFESYALCDHAQEWFDELNLMLHPLKLGVTV